MATKKQKIKEEATPKVEPTPEGEGSGYVVKEELLTKSAFRLDARTRQTIEVEVDYITVSQRGKVITLHKGVELPKKTLSLFSEENKKYFLRKI